MSLGLKDLQAAAATGNATSQFNLGVVYENLLDDTGGYGGKGNRAEAIKWLLQAAEQGLPQAQARLARLYADGPDTAGAHVRACTWFLVAATQLSGAQRERVQTSYDRIARQMAPEQVAKAQRRAQAWKATPYEKPQDAAPA